MTRISLSKVQTFRDLPAWFEWDFRSRRFGDLSFALRDQGWVLLADLLFHTVDGGQSWQFIEPKRPPGLVTASVCGDGPGSCWLTFSQTGVNRPTRIPIARFHRGELSQTIWVGATNGWYKVGSRLFLADEHGWLIAGESVNGKESGAIFAMDRDGKSWQVVARVPGVPTRACFADSNNGWLLVRGHTQERGRAFRVAPEGEIPEEFLIGGYTFSILSTADGGRSWATATTAECDLLGVIRADEVVCAFGAGGLILRSHDGGLTWGKVRSRTRNDIYALTFNRANCGLAVGDKGVILFSDDCGRSWTRVNHDLGGMSFHDVHFADERSGVIIDPKGIYRFVLQ